MSTGRHSGETPLQGREHAGTKPWPPFACPDCGTALAAVEPTRWACPADGFRLEQRDGIWRAVARRDASARETDERFLEGYRQVRGAEGWGSADPGYLRALPFRDLTGRHEAIWRIRAASYRALCRELGASPLRIADLGAGNGWLSLRLAAQGHRVVALDLSDEAADGLAAAARLPEAKDIAWIQAGFDRAPLAAGGCDVAVFNGAFHYSGDPHATLRECLRLLASAGRIAIVDTPFYRRATSGNAMLAERAEGWRRQHGRAVDPPDSEGFLTRARLRALGRELGIRWTFHALPLGIRWHATPWLAPLLGRREPARFPIAVGSRT